MAFRNTEHTDFGSKRWERMLVESNTAGYDVVVIGEALVELSSDAPLTEAELYVRSFSGDALNAAAAAAAAGARTALMTRVGDDEFGDALCDYATRLGIDVSPVVRTGDPNGIYFTARDPAGERHFVYHRRGSAASSLTPDNIDDAMLADCSVLLLSGVGCAISASSEATMYYAAKTVNAAGGHVIYDPNFRPRLSEAAEARRHLHELSEFAHIVTPSCPNDTNALLGTDDPVAAVRSCRDSGFGTAIATLGERGVLVADETGTFEVPAAAAEREIDATGCGDAFSGALAANIARGAAIERSATAAVEMASRCLAHRGGTSYLLPHSP